MKEAKPNIRHQQLRDFCACVRSQLAEIEGGTMGEGLDDAEGRMHIIRDQIDFVLLHLPRKALKDVPPTTHTMSVGDITRMGRSRSQAFTGADSRSG